MGDRTYTWIRFSGEIRESNVPALEEALRDQGCLALGDDADPAHDNIGEVFYDSECNYASMDELEKLARKLGLSYIKGWDAGGGYGPGLEMYFAVTNTVITCPTVDGEPAMGLSQLKELGFDAAAQYLQLFEADTDALPDLLVVPG